MGNKLTAIKIKHPDGTYSDQILIAALAENIRWDDTRSLPEIVDYLDERINNLARGEDGSTKYDQEIEDARVGADLTSDGKVITHTSLGDAVREQYLKSLKTVLVKTTQPTETENKLWINNSNLDEIDILTADELKMIAPIYDSTATYSIGDYVVHDGELYRCIVDISTAESWTAEHWEFTNVGNEISDLKSALNKTDLESTAFITRHNGMMNLSGTLWMYTTDSNYQHIVLPVSAGDTAQINASGNGVYWAFLKSYNTSAAPDLSSAMSGRQNNNYSGQVPTDASYLYVNLRNNGIETIPAYLIINDWDYSASAKSQLLANTENVYNCIFRNTPINIINENRINISKTSFTNGSVNVGFEEPDIITLGGAYSSGAQRITLNTGTLKANTKYTFFVKNTDGLVPSVGLADSSGFITYNGEKVETNSWNEAFVFQTGSSASSGVYAYLRVTASSLNNKLSIYVVEGEHETGEFYIYNKSKSRLVGKKVAWYGDSIVQGYAWCKIINDMFGFEATNCGSGGSRISYTNTRDDSMCLTTRMQGNYTPTSGIATAIPNDVEIIFVEGGINDWGNSVSIGNSIWNQNLDYTVFAEACHVMFSNLTTLFPNAEIIIIGTPWAKWANHFSDTYGILNNNGLQTVDYGDILLDVAGRWGINGINVSRLIGFNDNNISSYTSDGIHPNETGAKIIADVVANYLLSMN